MGKRLCDCKDCRQHNEDLIDQVIKVFKKNKGLPFAIRTKNCPNKNINCRKKHGEIVIVKFDTKIKKFDLDYYSMHIAKKVFEHKMDEKLVKKMLIDSMKDYVHGTKLRLSSSFYKKILKKYGMSIRGYHIRFRVNYDQKQQLLSKSNSKNMNVSAYIKSELFD